MEYLADPTLSTIAGCPQPWHSFAFIGSLVASRQDVAALQPAAERIFATFAPTPRWGAEVQEALFNAMQTRMAMIRQTLRNITRMEMEQRMREIQSIRRINQGWIDALGGVSRYRDPGDPSYEGTVP